MWTNSNFPTPGTVQNEVMNTDKSGKPILTTLVTSTEVLTVNAVGNVTVITTRDRETGKVATETFYGKNPLLNR